MDRTKVFATAAKVAEVLEEAGVTKGSEAGQIYFMAILSLGLTMENPLGDLKTKLRKTKLQH